MQDAGWGRQFKQYVGCVVSPAPSVAFEGRCKARSIVHICDNKPCCLFFARVATATCGSGRVGCSHGKQPWHVAAAAGKASRFSPRQHPAACPLESARPGVCSSCRTPPPDKFLEAPECGCWASEPQRSISQARFILRMVRCRSHPRWTPRLPSRCYGYCCHA